MPDEEAVAHCNALMGLGDGPPPSMRRETEEAEPVDPDSMPF